MWQLRPRRQPNAGLSAEHQPIIRDSAQDVTLALGVRLRLPNSSIEQAKSCGKIANDARGLQLQVIERPESLQPRAALVPPPSGKSRSWSGSERVRGLAARGAPASPRRAMSWRVGVSDHADGGRGLPCAWQHSESASGSTGPVLREEGDKAVGMIQKCPNPDAVSCKCATHRETEGWHVQRPRGAAAAG